MTSRYCNAYRKAGDGMKIAVIGTGIAGNVVAHKLHREHDITVFEAAGYVGGHTNTVDVTEGDRQIPIDTGFIVFNDRTYPYFIQLLDELGQRSQPSEMSFSVRSEAAGLEYNGASLNALFAQRRNLLRPSFYRMIRDILRFNEAALASVNTIDEEQTLGDYLDSNGYGREFSEYYLVPMAAAIWSAESVSVLKMPMSFLVRFFANHGLLQLKDRPQWRVIEGGSREYVDKLVCAHRDRIRLSTPVRSVRRVDDKVEIRSDSGGTELFDYAFIACHSDQALSMLADPSRDEQQVLGAIRYQPNEAILHTDESLMPRKIRAWAAWNYHLPATNEQHVAVTYSMNILQRLETREQYFLTLNSDCLIDPDKIIKRVSYDHPMFSRDAIAAQCRQVDINVGRTFYCGAYWRNGFHEDGVVSALNALGHFEEGLAHAELHLRRTG